jgi:replicative DNA helicase
MSTQEQLAYSKGLPVNIDAERFVLGSIMLSDGAYTQVAEIIGLDDLAIEKHRRIFARMKELADRGEKIDRVTVANELMRKGQLESVDGLGYLVSLDEGLPEIANLESYIRIVKSKSTLRKTIFAADRVIKKCLVGEEEPEEILAGAQQALATLEQQSLIEGAIGSHEMIATTGLDRLLAPRTHGSIRLPFGKLDDALGGFHGGQMVVLMARTSRGKSSMAFQVASAAAEQDRTPVIWTMEMSREECFRCLIQQISGVWPGRRSVTFEERREVASAGAQLNEKPIFFDSSSRTVAQFVAGVRRLGAKAKVGLAVVDHLQLIRGGSAKNRAQEVSDNSRALKNAAMDLDIPFMVLSQVDRASVKGDGKIGLHSSKESGDVENDADVVLWIDAEEEFSWEHDTRISLHIGKQRSGRAGFKIPMVFRPTHRTFLEVAGD